MTTITAKPLTARPLTARPLTAYRLGESTEGANPLVWHAATPDSDGVMRAQLIGSGTPSFTVDSGLLMKTSDGGYIAIAANTPPWHGARWVDGVAYGTDGSGDPLDPLPSLYGAPAYTNSLAYSNQLDNAAWTKVIATVTANQAIGLAGAMDADEVSFAGGYIYNTTNIAGAAGQVVTCRIFVKAKNTATKIKVRIDRAGAAQGNQTDYDLNPTGYTEIIHTATLDGGTGTPVLRLDQPATGAGDAVYYIANTETHAARTAAQVRGSAPIITAASTVTTTAITDVHDSGNWVDTSGGLYCEVTLQVAQNILSTFLDVSGSTFRLNDGTNTVTAAWVTNTAYQLGIAWDAAAGTMAINVDGTWSSNATYDGTLLAGALDIFRSPAGVGLMRNLKRYSASDLAAAKALVDGDMP